MIRKLAVSQKQAASKLFQQTSLLVVAGIGYQYVHGSLLDVIVLTGRAIGFGFYSVVAGGWNALLDFSSFRRT